MPTLVPKISVLMPAFNAGTYIREAIDSILVQTFTDFEFLIIDDGSTDNTLALIKSYSDPRIKVVSRPNKGLIDTLNEGLQLARANLVARFDADDICLPARLEEQYNFLQQHHDYILVGSDVNYLDKDGNFLLRINPVGHSFEEIKTNFYTKCPFLHPTVMFRKDEILEVGGYPKNALTFEDYLLWARLLDRGKMCNIDHVLVNMRLNPDSVTIDERWRGKEFKDIRVKSLRNGYVTEEDAQRLKEIIESQNFGSYKKASYYAMVGKKHLWDNTDSAKARANLALAISHYPKNLETYILYLFSFVPGAIRKGVYKMLKKK